MMSGQVGYWLLRMEEHVADHIGHLFLTNHLDTYFCFCFLCGQKNSSADFYHNQNIYWKQDTCVCASALYIVWWCIHTEVIDAEACVHANKPCLWMTKLPYFYIYWNHEYRTYSWNVIFTLNWPWVSSSILSCVCQIYRMEEMENNIDNYVFICV